MSKTLLLYSSVHGQTRKICDVMAKQLGALGQQVTMAAIDDAPDLADFDRVAIGASIRHGKHNPAVFDYIRQHQQQLESKANGFFSVSLVARKPEKNTPETNPYMQAFLAKTEWKPKQLAVFGGNLDYQATGPWTEISYVSSCGSPRGRPIPIPASNTLIGARCRNLPSNWRRKL